MSILNYNLDLIEPDYFIFHIPDLSRSNTRIMKKVKFRSIVIFLGVIQLVFYSCKKEPAVILPIEPVSINLTASQLSLINSENSFAFDIFKKVLDNSAESDNIIISPLSISSALSMTVNGANGPTRDSMLATLRMNGLTPEIINNSYKDLTASLLSVDQRVLISVANSVWIENNFVTKKSFADILSQYYNAESKSFSISDPMVPKQVNSWIEDKTNGLIKNMVDQLDPRTVMLLINAIYFKGKWNSQFDKVNTVPGPFYKSDGTTAQTQMMKQTSEYNIFNGEEFTLAEFAYGQGNFVMDVILPTEKDGLKTITPLITNNNINTWLRQMVKRKTELTFPKFKYGFKKELKDILEAMGMGIAFGDKADFSNISDFATQLSFVLHQAFIETNEEGTEAAAATVVGIIATSAPAGPIVLNIDHPFLYIIRETSTNSILFIGKVADPMAE